MRTSPPFTSPTLPALLGLLALAGTLASPLVTPLAAQDNFGAAVTLTPAGEVVVLKPGAAIGPSSAIVFRLGADGTWSQTQRLSKLSGGYPGEVLLPELSAGGDFVLLGSGDPDGREAGHLYQTSADGWLPRLRVPVDQAAPAAAGLPAG